MKIFLSAFAVVSVALGFETWNVMPIIRVGALREIAWFQSNAEIWIFGIIVAVVILDFLIKNWRSGK